MTYEQELQELEQKAADKKRELEAKYRVLNQLGTALEGYEPPLIVCSPLYGTHGVIHLKPAFAESLAKGKEPDRALFADLLKRFPPVPKVLVTDGSRSFRAEGDWKGEQTPVAPVTVHLETFQSQEARFEWSASMGKEIWRFDVQFPLYKTTLGTVELRAERDRRGNVIEYVSCIFMPAPNSGIQQIKWASGGPEYPNSFTLYWHNDAIDTESIPLFVKEAAL